MFLDDNNVRDHCHITGFYRGSAHYTCNINLQITKKLPIVFHNLKEYGSHLIFKELSKFDDCKISVIHLFFISITTISILRLKFLKNLSIL